MSSAVVRVEKATSDLLVGPDWTLNMDICDSINSNHWHAKDVVKALKKRLKSKNPRVQLLALTLLEAMVKNCGDYVHFQISERKILQEMIKNVKKKWLQTDMHVRDKILLLLDSWQEAFGGPGGKHPQYYWAYDELRRSGVQFPQRSPDAAPIFTPAAQSTARHALAGYGMPINTTQRLDEAMASEMESLSLSNLTSIKSVSEVLDDMLEALNPGDRQAVKDDVIEELVNRCRSNQRKLMQMLNSTVDEELLGQGLEVNDNLQSLLAKHDAIASGSHLPPETFSPSREVIAPSGNCNHGASISAVNSSPRTVVPLPNLAGSQTDSDGNGPGPITPTSCVSLVSDAVDEEEDDEFAQLARRRSKPSPVLSQESSDLDGASKVASELSKELALSDAPLTPRSTNKEQDLIDLLSITLSTGHLSSPHPSPTFQSASNQSGHLVPVAPLQQEYSGSPRTPPMNGVEVNYNSYVAPWARLNSEHQNQPIKNPHYTSSYPAPPWVSPSSSEYVVPPSVPYPFNSYQGNYPYMPPDGYRSLQHYNSFPARQNGVSVTPGAQEIPNPTIGMRSLQNHYSFVSRGNSVSPLYSEAQQSPKPKPPGNANGQKPFVPSYRLFEDLIDLRNSDGSVKSGITSPTGFSSSPGQSMVGGRKW